MFKDFKIVQEISSEEVEVLKIIDRNHLIIYTEDII